jgi:hypothetical protein
MSMASDKRREWNKIHGLIRKFLMQEKDYRKALPLLLEHHAAVHSATLPPLREGRGGRWSYQDEVLGALTEAQMRIIPKGGQSVIWKLWHITRIEDLTVSLLLSGAKHSMLTDKWLERLGTRYVDAGNGMPNADVSRISKTMNIKALLAYRRAVGKRTQNILRTLNPGTLWEKPAPERMQRIVDEKGVRENSAWLLKFWGGNPYANILLMPATRHPFVHLNEISRMMPSLRKVE